MWAASTAIWCATLGVVFCAAISREKGADENTFDYPVKPQLFNQLLQELIEKDKLPTNELKTQDQQYQALLQEQFQSHFDDQFQKPFQNQPQPTQQANKNAGSPQKIFLIPENYGYAYNVYRLQPDIHSKQKPLLKYQKQTPQKNGAASFNKSFQNCQLSKVSARQYIQSPSKHRHQPYEQEAPQKISRD